MPIHSEVLKLLLEYVSFEDDTIIIICPNYSSGNKAVRLVGFIPSGSTGLESSGEAGASEAHLPLMCARAVLCTQTPQRALAVMAPAREKRF